MIAFLVGLATPFAACVVVLAVSVATERTTYSCRDCRWSTGWRGALPAWLRWRWHRHVTRPLGRCRSVPR